MQIKYTYPISGVIDLQARLMLSDIAVSDWVTASEYAIQTIHAGYIAEFDDMDADAVQWASPSQGIADEKALPTTVEVDSAEVADAVVVALEPEFELLGTLAKQEEILTAIGNIEGGGSGGGNCDLGDMPEQVEFIYNKFTYIPDDAPAIVLPGSSSPGMAMLVVTLRHGSTPVNGETVKATMYQQGNVYLDGAHEVSRTYTGITGPYVDDEDVTHQGVALIELFDSPKLETAGYNGLYRVEAPGVQRDVWIPEGGGELGLLQTGN